MAIADGDVSVTTNGDIRWEGGAATTYTVLELHRWLQDKADNASYSGDDILDITDDTPSDRSTDNIITLNDPFNINDELAEHLYDGSITQKNGNEIYSGLRVLGAVNNSATQLMVYQNNAQYSYTGSPLNPFWGTQAAGGLNGDAASGILMRCLIKSRVGSPAAGADIDGKRIRVQARHWGDSYDFFNVTLGEGESVAAISTTPDAQNDGSPPIVTAYTNVTNIEGFQTIDLNNGNGAKEYYAKWGYTTDDQADGLKSVWEYTKDLTGYGTAKTIHGINGELFLGITHSIVFGSPYTNTPFVEDDILSWGSGATAGTGLVLAYDGNDPIGDLYIQLLTGVAPTGGATLTGTTGSPSYPTALVTTVTSRTVPKHFLGSYTGTLIGAYGIGGSPNGLTSNDTLEDLNGSPQVPPNNVTFTIGNLESDEDYVLIGPREAGLLDLDQLALEGSPYTYGPYIGGSPTEFPDVRIGSPAAIPTDTPSTGQFRVFDGSSYVKVTYTGYSGDTFSGCVGMPAASADANMFISYIDEICPGSPIDSLSFTGVYSSDRALFVRVRDGGTVNNTPIVTFETPATFGGANTTISAIRTADD